MEAEPPLLLVAASGLAREVAEAARAARRSVLGCLDDDPDKWDTDQGAAGEVLGGLEVAADHPEAGLVVCAGRGAVRQDLVSRLRAELGTEPMFATVIHPSVDVPESCRVGEGSVLLAGTVLTADVRVGRHVVCMPHVSLTHDDVIHDYVTLCAGVTLGGGVAVGEGAYLGMASSVHPNRRVGEGALLGMGAVLLRDQPAHATWVGNPARQLDARG